MNISSHKNTILIIIAVLVVFFGYWFFFLSKKDASIDTQNTSALQAGTPAANTTYDKEFVTSLLGLNSVNLDVSIFQSKVYQALSYPEVPFVVNYSRDTGRDNPFLPIGIDATVNQTVQTQNKPTETNTSPAPTTSSSTTPKPTPKTF